MILSKQIQVLIETSLAQGRDYEDIRNILLKQGFKDDDISELFSAYRGGEVVASVAPQIKEVVQTPEPELKAPISKAKDQLLVETTKTENVSANYSQVQSSIDETASGYEESLVKYPGEKISAQDIGQISKKDSEKYINVGFAGMPELENVLAEEEFKKKEKSAAPLVITLLTLVALIGGFLYWLLVLTDGGAATPAVSPTPEDIETTETATPTPPEIPGSRDPFTGELFEVE